MADRMQAGDGEELWRWALQAPPVQARSLLQAIPAGTSPPFSLGQQATDLQAMAQGLPDAAEAKGVLAQQASRLLKHHKWPVNAIAWSPDGRHLASVGSKAIQLWDGASGACLRRLVPSAGRFNTVAWSPDGRLLAAEVERISSAYGYAHWIGLWDTDGGPCLQTLSDAARPWTMRWLGDDHQLAYVSTRNEIRVWNATTNTCTPILKGHPWHEDHLAWSPDGRRLASAGREGTIALWDLANGTRTHTLQGHGKRISALVWSPDGRQLASASADQTIRLWDPSSGACTHTLQGHGERVIDLAWSPDGQALATAHTDQTVRLWDGARGVCRQILAGHQHSMHGIAFSPDGRCLASTSADRTIRLWDADKGLCIHRLARKSEALSSITWSPDGRTLAVIDGDPWIQLWRRDLLELASLLETPLARFDRHHWDLMAACPHACPPRDTVVLPWLRFITALGIVIRRFDVEVAEASVAHGASAFAVILDG
jgi:WD40 repeat protein